MALEKIPADIRRDGGVCRMSNPKMITDIKKTYQYPLWRNVELVAAEAQILESLEIDFVDESEVLTPADNSFHVDKNPFKVPFVCGARNLSEATRRINEGAAMIEQKVVVQEILLRL